MTRRLVVMRHAKSAYPRGVVDHDRPLAPRGVVDARAAGEWVHDHVGRIDQVVVSSARRTRETWTLAGGAIGRIGPAGHDVDSPGALTIDPRVYDASTDTLLEVLRELPDRVVTALLVGHNPGCESLVTLLSGSADPEASRLIAAKYPTAGVAVLEVDGTWAELGPGVAHLTAFAVPRGAPPS